MSCCTYPPKIFPPKTALDVKDYGVDCSPVGLDGPLTGVTFTVISGDVNIDRQGMAPDGFNAVVWLSGGTAATQSELSLEFETATQTFAPQTVFINISAC